MWDFVNNAKICVYFRPARILPMLSLQKIMNLFWKNLKRLSCLQQRRKRLFLLPLPIVLVSPGNFCGNLTLYSISSEFIGSQLFQRPFFVWAYLVFIIKARDVLQLTILLRQFSSDRLFHLLLSCSNRASELEISSLNPKQASLLREANRYGSISWACMNLRVGTEVMSLVKSH